MFNFNMFGETYEVDFEIYIEDKLSQRQKMKAPKEMLIINFVQTMEQIGRNGKPMKIKMIVPMTIYDNFEKKEKVLNNEVEFKNNAMIAWEESKQESEAN